MGLPDGCGILIAKWQEVEKLSQVEQSLNIILKSTVSHTYEKAIRELTRVSLRWVKHPDLSSNSWLDFIC